jgi:hypothetical protein
VFRGRVLDHSLGADGLFKTEQNRMVLVSWVVGNVLYLEIHVAKKERHPILCVLRSSASNLL